VERDKLRSLIDGRMIEMKRRTFLLGAASGIALGSQLGALGAAAAAASTGRLTLGTRTLDVNGKAATVYGLRNAHGGYGVEFTAGDSFDIALENTLSEQAMIHWHGLTPPVHFDGVPDQPLPLLAAGETRTYKFPVGPGGTHWMHAHTLQEQNLLAAPLIVRTREDLAADRQEVVLMLHDFSFTPAAELLAGLGGGGSGGGSMGGMDMSGMDMGQTGTGKMSLPGMTMDLNDIAYDAYLANDRTLDDPEVVAVEKSGHIRLRIINGAAATGFTIDLGALTGSLVAVDGQAVMPLEDRQFPISMGQRLDIELALPAAGGAFPILALREGAPERTGIVLATPGAAVAKLASMADAAGPVLDLALEAQLRATTPLSSRAADRTLTAHLSGSMSPYAWTMAGGPFTVHRGERAEIEMMNMSMMAHPMHLHGHHFQVVAINGRRFAGAMRDTVLVPPMQTVTVAFDADNAAPNWAFHCHHLYHMASGMMAALSYEDA
jgi:FtsP/CotA-like multicopper oxidase with cupredoxin domain